MSKAQKHYLKMRAHAQKHGDAGIQRIVFKNWLPDHPGQTGDQKTTEFPGVFERLEELARLCGARHGALGAFIEDKNSGTILLQQAARRNWTAHPIESKLTAMARMSAQFLCPDMSIVET
jgi:hypothetical protein